MLMEMKVGFIGAGNMATAIFSGMLKKNIFQKDQIYLYDINSNKLAAHVKTFGIHVVDTINELTSYSDIIIIAVKPNVAREVLSQITCERKCILSIVTGLSYRDLKENTAGEGNRFLRIMPNTPLLIGAGATAFAMPYTLEDGEIAIAERIFSSLGRVEYVPENLISAVTGISGSGPAYGYLFIEALADAGVKHGLPRDLSVRLAAQTILGAAAMVLETGKHTGILKDEVCSPGGTTIEAVAKLEECGLRNAVFQAVDACVEKANRI